ncbi:MAG: acyl-CoA dehydrogenase [Acidobacteriota bacterium]
MTAPNDDGFLQDPPQLANTYRADGPLRRILARRLAAGTFEAIAPDLDRLGALAAGPMAALAREAERDAPRHVPFDAWGRRIDALELAPAWAELLAIAAREGIVAEAYERRFGAASRLVQMARLYLYHPSSAIASCPLAMSDGAARVLELHGTPQQRARVLPRLIARDATQAWTSGQWMTERSGGSDVSTTETMAHPAPDGGWELSGVKWFSSATSAEVALALARIAGDPPGNRGLSLFLVELEGQVGRTIRILRLKDKLGTRALPTAELELAGCRAELVGKRGRGVATVATMLNVTRYYNTVCAAGYLARGLQLARDYAARRRAFGETLATLPLHAATLADLACEHAGALELAAECAALVGREELGEASAEERARLRLLTPVAKLLTARQAVAGAAEAIESFGGAGYVETTGLPALARDAQVLPIWEGTTNVLALDALRAIEREGALGPFVEDTARRLAAAALGLDAAGRETLESALRAAVTWHRSASGDRARLEAGARDVALALGRVLEGVLLAESAAASGSQEAGELAARFAARSVPALRGERPFAETARLAIPPG